MLTRDEKDTIARYLALDPNPRQLWWDMAPYLGPLIVFAAYACWSREFLAMALAFVVLLFLAIWYVSYQARSWVHLHSALRKYEETVRALEQPDAEA